MLNHDLQDLLKQGPTGVLQLGGARMALLDIEAGFWGIRRQVEALIGERLANSVLQQAGANGGASFARSIQGQIIDKPAAFSACVQAYQAAGFGQFDILSMEWPLGRIHIQAKDSFEAWMFQQHKDVATTSICAYSAGVFVGFVNIIGERQDVVCIEHTCQARGDKTCLFELLPASQARDQEVVPYTPDPGLGRQINLLEMLFERMPMGIAIFDREYRLIRNNQTWAEFIDRYTPSSVHDVLPGVRFTELAPGAENFFTPIFERVFCGETVRMDSLQSVSGGIVSYWDAVFSPLMEGGKVVGVLDVTIDATDRVLLHRNLEQRVEARTREIERRREVAESLGDIMAVLNSNRSPKEIFKYITQQSADLLAADASLLYSARGLEIIHEAAYKLPDKLANIKLGQLYPGEANQQLLNQQPVLIQEATPYLDNLLAQADLSESQRDWYTTIRENFQSYFGIPLIVRNQLFGGLILYFKEKCTFSAEDIQLGITLGEHAALAIENARLRQEERARSIESERRYQVAESLRDIVAILNSKKSLDEILDYIVMKASQILESEACILHHIQEEQNFVAIEASHGLPKSLKDVTGFPLYSSRRSDDRILKGEPVWLADLRASPPLTESELAALHPNVRAWREITHRFYRAWIAVPLIVENRVYGSLAFYFASPKDFNEEEIKLCQSFAGQAAVAIENARLQQAEQDRQRELKMLLEVASAANSSLDLHETLTKTMDLLIASISASWAGVILVEEGSGELLPHTIRPVRELKLNELGDLLQACQAAIASGEIFYNANPEKGGSKPCVLLPLQIRRQSLGVLAIIGQEGNTFTPGQLMLFKSIADQLSVAIDNAHLFKKAEEVAVAAERNRLARDLHDAVTQTLFSSSLIADVLPKIWERNPVEGRNRLEELRQLTRGALSEMRTLLLELRPTALVDTDLGDLIGHQVNAFIARTRLSVEYQRNCKQSPPPDIKEMFYRITQEAFNNIAKHADATTVIVHLDCQPEKVELLIQDNGNGFDLEHAMTEGLGLNIMQERANSVGALLKIHSRIKEGTQLHIFWPDESGKEDNCDGYETDTSDAGR